MLVGLLAGTPVEPHAKPPPRASDGASSAYLQAILDACAHPTSPPTLRQLPSHPYFAPVEGFDRDDVRAAYKRWKRQGGAVGPRLS